MESLRVANFYINNTLTSNVLYNSSYFILRHIEILNLIILMS